MNYDGKELIRMKNGTGMLIKINNISANTKFKASVLE